MKNIACLFLTLLLISGVTAQDRKFSPPDYKKISKVISRAGSPFSYSELSRRLSVNDTTLTVSDYHYLYYGSTLQPGFNPDVQHPLADSITLIMNKEGLNKTDYAKIIQLGIRLLGEQPFELRMLDPLIYAYRMTGNNDMAARLEVRFGRIIETIFNSGDGLTKKTAFHVISTRHEPDMLRALGFGYDGQKMRIEETFDYLKTAKNDFGIEGIWFKAGLIYGQ
jgi:hypothetical protein